MASPKPHPKDQLAEARRIVEGRLAACASEILRWHASGTLPDGVVRQAAACITFTHDPIQQVERLVSIAALTKVACGHPGVIPGGVYRFTKSGNTVRAIANSGRRPDGVTEWEVERVDGESAGKRMVVGELALETVDGGSGG